MKSRNLKISDTIEGILEDYAERIKCHMSGMITKWSDRGDDELAIDYFCHALHESRQDFVTTLDKAFENTYGENHESWPAIVKSFYLAFDHISQYSTNNISEEDNIFTVSKRLTVLSDQDLKRGISKYLKTAIEDYLQIAYPKYAAIKDRYDNAREGEENNKMTEEDECHVTPKERGVAHEVTTSDIRPKTILRTAPRSESQIFLNGFHKKFENEVLSGFVDAETNSEFFRPQSSINYANHIETIHHSLHVLSGGTITSTMTGPLPGNPTNHKILMYFNLFKGLSDGVLFAEDFREYREYGRIRETKLLLDGDAEVIREFADALQIKGDFEAYRQHIAATSKNYVEQAFRWMNQFVVSGDIDAREYVLKINEAETNAANPTLIQKIYLNSNTKILLESYDLEGAASDNLINASPSLATATRFANLRGIAK